MPKLKSKDSRQGSLFAPKEVPEVKFLFEPELDKEQDRVEAAADFIIERHKIFLKRTRGLPKPWTDDPILRVGKFTNIYRELDPGTTWIIDNIIKPYKDHPELWFMLCIARLINWPDTLQDLMDNDVWPVKSWNPDNVYRVLHARTERREKVITGAYIINSVPPKGFDNSFRKKDKYIPYCGLDLLWQERRNIRDSFKSSMTEAMETLSGFHGWGAFLSNQVLVDLSYTKKWLGRAQDLNTFTSPGPGTTKGMNWMITGRMDSGIRGKHLNEHMIRFRALVNAAVKAKVPSKFWTGDFKTGFADISMPNYSNCNCELSKMVRSIKDGDGSRMKNRYDGG